MNQTEQLTFPSSDGVHTIWGTLWLPDGQPPRAVVQIVHGVAEYVERYEAFARYLTRQGYAVCGEDHLGHGRTGQQGERMGYFGTEHGWDTVVADVRQLRVQMGERFPGLPYFLLGHSMGSFLARTYLCRYPGTVDGCILSGTGQEPRAVVRSGWLVASLLCKMKGPQWVSGLVYNLSLGRYNRKFRPNRTPADWICRDEEVVDCYLRDPLCTFRPTVGMFRDMLGGLLEISRPDSLEKMDRATPIYLFSGTQDPVGGDGLSGVHWVYQRFRRCGVEDVRLKEYPGGRHEMLNECNRDEVYRDVLDWLEEHLA